MSWTIACYCQAVSLVNEPYSERTLWQLPTNISHRIVLVLNNDGRGVFLRQKGKTPDEVAELEDEANRRLSSICWWGFFNIGLGCAGLLEPALKCVKLVPMIVVASVDSPGFLQKWEHFVMILVFLPLTDFVEAFMLVVMKWCMIGRFKERDVPFFGLQHYLWSVWLMVSCSFNHLDSFHGTALYCTFLRMMGSQVGRDCTLFGFTLEFDLLHIGDRVHVGLDCDNTCHTVENMVLKMVPVKLASDSAMQDHSFVMPGASLSEKAVLLEESQVLKGDNVPPGEVWAGNPAQPVPKLNRDALDRVRWFKGTHESQIPHKKIAPLESVATR